MLCHQRTQLHSSFTVLDGGCCLFLPFSWINLSNVYRFASEWDGLLVGQEWETEWANRLRERTWTQVWKELVVRLFFFFLLIQDDCKMWEEPVWASVNSRSMFSVTSDGHLLFLCPLWSISFPSFSHIIKLIIVTGNMYVCIGMSSNLSICILSVVNALYGVCFISSLLLTSKCEYVKWRLWEHWCVCVRVRQWAWTLNVVSGESWRIPKERLHLLKCFWMPSFVFLWIKGNSQIKLIWLGIWQWLIFDCYKLIELQKLI